MFCTAGLKLVNHFVLVRCALPKPSQLRPRSVRMVAERLLGQNLLAGVMMCMHAHK